MTFASRATLAYLTISVIWIILSDRLIFFLSTKWSKDDLLLLQSGKGIFFISFTALLLYLALRKYRDRQHKYIKEIKKSVEENEKLVNILNCVSNMAILTDKDSKICWVNRAFYEFTGFTSEEIIGQMPFILHKEKTDSITVSRIKERCARHEFFKEELINYKKNGEHYWVELSFSPMFCPANEFKGYVTIQSVITDRKIKDEQIQQQNEVLREMAWLNSHEIRKSVANMLGLLALCPDQQTEEDSEVFRLLHQSTHELDTALKRIADKSNKFYKA
ncbi:PAS domain-containing protein [Desertivirga brevis]|uniref:PAS domain-containing protein n=1 Tax=Desertivirga brevis TaxID=2810310 RepID=UPI001A95C454|nr:PAS domain-containing protein [Pedobacter sp. SYSU D00873]